MDTLKSRLLEGLTTGKGQVYKCQDLSKLPPIDAEHADQVNTTMPQVSGEIDRIQESLEVLCKVAEELEIRLASVLRQSDPILTEKDGDKKMLVPLAEIIRKFNETIRQQSLKITNIIDRVEL